MREVHSADLSIDTQPYGLEGVETGGKTRTVAAPQGEQSSSDMEDIDRDSQPDCPHPWPYLKEMAPGLMVGDFFNVNVHYFWFIY